jgi:glucan phosphoethanolaminetransferase (alkaline phosphatase superfamily)
MHIYDKLIFWIVTGLVTPLIVALITWLITYDDKLTGFCAGLSIFIVFGAMIGRAIWQQNRNP